MEQRRFRVKMFKRYCTDSCFLNFRNTMSRSSRPEVFCKKGALRDFAKFTGKHRSHRRFSGEFCEISITTFSYRTPPVAASVCQSFKLYTFTFLCGIFSHSCACARSHVFEEKPQVFS